MTKSFWSFLLGPSLVNRLARLVAINGALAAVLQVADFFFDLDVSFGILGVLIYVLVSLNIFLLSEILLLRMRPGLVVGNAVDASVEESFAEAIVIYAEALAGYRPPRNDALMDLRKWTTRFLHLNGCYAQRVRLGELAFRAAVAKEDEFTQASILIDDLGWSRSAAGDPDSGRENIQEGQRILSQLPAEERGRTEVVELQIKAKRHLVGAQFDKNQDLDVAMRGISEIRDIALVLLEPDQGLHLAQLDHAEAAITLRWIDKRLGLKGKVDPSGEINIYYQRALECARSADRAFGSLGDLERQIKIAGVHVRLLEHGESEAARSRLQAHLNNLSLKVARRV